MEPDNHIHSDTQNRRSFAAMRLAAGEAMGIRWNTKKEKV